METSTEKRDPWVIRKGSGRLISVDDIIKKAEFFRSGKEGYYIVLHWNCSVKDKNSNTYHHINSDIGRKLLPVPVSDISFASLYHRHCRDVNNNGGERFHIYKYGIRVVDHSKRAYSSGAARLVGNPQPVIVFKLEDLPKMLQDDLIMHDSMHKQNELGGNWGIS